LREKTSEPELQADRTDQAHVDLLVAKTAHSAGVHSQGCSDLRHGHAGLETDTGRGDPRGEALGSLAPDRRKGERRGGAVGELVQSHRSCEDVGVGKPDLVGSDHDPRKQLAVQLRELTTKRAETPKICQAARVQRRVELEAVPLLLPDHVPVRVLEVSLIGDRPNSGRLERHGYAKHVPRRDLDGMGKLSSFDPLADQEDVQVVADEPEGEQPSSVAVPMEESREPPPLRRARGEEASVHEAHDDVPAQGCFGRHALFVDDLLIPVA
jgi:hypothetical protein